MNWKAVAKYLAEEAESLNKKMLFAPNRNDASSIGSAVLVLAVLSKAINHGIMEDKE